MLNDETSIFYSKNTIKRNNLYKTYYGIYIKSGSENNTLSYNNITNSQYGIYSFASFNDVFHNRLINNTYGIYLNNCYLNNIFLNNITGNHWGIRLKAATNTQIYENQIQNNIDGVYSCCGAEQNTIFKNNFINNNENAYDDLSSYWYKNTIGNSWSDYSIKYPNAQSQDNIWDTPYSIRGGVNQDRYPLVKPFST